MILDFRFAIAMAGWEIVYAAGSPHGEMNDFNE
jgi:hypothetical protein